MTAEEKNVTVRECDIKHENLNETLKEFKMRLDRLENKFWAIIVLLVGNLIGIITLLIRWK